MDELFEVVGFAVYDPNTDTLSVTVCEEKWPPLSVKTDHFLERIGLFHAE
jgi:hypothetical protein